MGKIQIIADSTCDLGEELINELKIDILPLYVTIGDKTGKDGLEIKPDEIYEWADLNNDTPKTSAISPDDTMNLLQIYKNNGDDVIFIGISEEMSATCNVVRLMAEDLEYSDKVHVVNSKNLSTGIGFLVLEAVRMAEQGKAANEIVKVLEGLRDKVRSSFVIDTLTYLHRGGRCNAMQAVLANTLKLKPKIVVVNGKMDVDSKYRGKQSAVVGRYVQDLRQQLLKADPQRVFVTHSGIDESVIENVVNYLKSMKYFDEITVTRAGGVISSHCGPGTLGVLYLEQ